MARRIPLSHFEHRSSRNIASFTRKRVSLHNLKTKATIAPTTTDSTNPLLLTQKDWPLWFQFIHQKASFTKIWDYVDLDKAENKIKENTEPKIPLIAAAPAAPVILVVTPAILVTTFTILAATFIAPVIILVVPATTPMSIGIATPVSLN